MAKYYGYCHIKIQDLRILLDYQIDRNHCSGQIGRDFRRNRSFSRIPIGICNLDADDSPKDCKSFLERLQIEEYNLYASISMLAQQQLRGADVYQDKQKALVQYITNGEFIF